MAKTPDFVEPFVGWKGLIADSDGSLHSPMGDAVWPAREALVAECTAGNDHRPPAARCHCGIYAVDSFETLQQYGYNWQEVGYPGSGHADHPRGVWVIAEIKLWGDIREGRIGWRAEYAYIESVHVPATKWKLGRTIGARYKCAVKLIDRFTGERS